MSECGCDAVLFTCSAFGAPIEKVKAQLGGGVTVLKPNEAMMEDAVRTARAAKKGSKIGILATFAPTVASITTELGELLAAEPGQAVELVARHGSRHCALIARVCM